jgi:hypothetical protein
MQEYRSVETVVTPESQASASNAALGRFSLIVIFAVTVLLIWGMSLDQKRVALAFLCGTAFAAFLVIFVVLVLSGQLAAIIINGQKERTKREHDRMQYWLYMREAPQMTVFEPEQVEESRNFLPTANFVAARSEANPFLQVAAYEFILQLFEDGENPGEKVIDRDKILGEGTKRPGQIQNTKKPREEVVNLLLELGVVTVNEWNMLVYNERQYPTLRDVHQTIMANVPGGR